MLMTPMTPKMRARPMATIPYRPPRRIPLVRTWSQISIALCSLLRVSSSVTDWSQSAIGPRGRRNNRLPLRAGRPDRDDLAVLDLGDDTTVGDLQAGVVEGEAPVEGL